MRRGLGLGQGKGYYNLAYKDPYVHGLSAKGVKSKYFDRYYNLKKMRKEQQGILNIERGLATPSFGAVSIRGASAVLGLGFDAVGVTIPAVGLAVGGLLGGIYLKEKIAEKKYKEKIRLNLDARAKLKRSIMWNPKSGEILQGNDSHMDVLKQKYGVKEVQNHFNEWVRAIYEPERKKLFVRHYFNPKSRYAEFTSKEFDISERMQGRLVKRLQKKGLPANTNVVYNVTNEKLMQEGYIHV